ncbi:Zinc finger, CCCH-type [Kalmanozyma brasiliensis GHG001]|uniref:Zinc finger, CCCH-type n=1 Tax=Kalmanozyma brasiliensis (strain GHG001) TaxID=1365824 RepID=UPI002868139B|nr:Zinc finger, CCCH-type [Kalmanozyma brasiliensis GHG001]EST07612.2 Zinc finger, CCCH-type [Kalmanozyma brasiliensis GHG001]
MTQYWNNAHFAASPKNVPYTLPKPSTFGAKHSGQESRSFTSSHSFFDFTDAWRERIRQSDRRPDDVVRTNSQLEVSDISRFLQNPTGPTNAWPVASQGFSTRRSWLDGNDIFSSSSPTSEVSDPSNTRASQSISPRTSIGSQDWEFCPTWSLNNAAKDFVPTKKAETAGECFSFSSQSQAMSNNPFVLGSGSYPTPQSTYAAHQQRTDFNAFRHTQAVSPPRALTSYNKPYINSQGFESQPAPQAPIGSRAPRLISSNPFPTAYTPTFGSSCVQHSQVQSEQRWQIDSQPRPSFFPVPSPPAPAPVLGSWNAPRAVVAPPRLDAGHGHWNGSSGTTHEPRGPSPFNHKTELYKTELCRNWEEKGFCYYGDRCQFAHGEHDLRPIQRDPRWKTRQCKAFKEYAALWRTYNPWFLSLRLFPSFRLSCAARNGSCHFAKRCCFRHDQGTQVASAASANLPRRSCLLHRVGVKTAFNRWS